MADAKIINYGQQISAGSTAIPDNTAVALDIESTDAKDYITVQTTDSDERIILSQEVTVPDGSINNPSLRFTGHNTGLYNDGGNIAMVLDGSRYVKFGTGFIHRYDVSKGFEIDTAAGTATDPVYTFNGDTNTGIGTAADDQLSLIAGGVEVIRATSKRGATVNGSAVVKGKASFVLTGSIDVTGTNTNVPGTGTKYLSELAIGDDILVTGETRTIATISSDTVATVTAAWGSNLDDDSSPECNPAAFTVVRDTGVLGMVVADDGSVGIGEATNALAPTSRFSVSAGNSNVAFFERAGNSGYFKVESSSDTATIVAGEVLVIKTNGGTEALRVAANQRVSIGNTSADKILHVTGDVKFTATVLGAKFADQSDSSWFVDPNNTTTAAKLAGPVAIAAVGSEPAAITDCAQFYAIGASAEMYVQDETGAETLLSPHNFEMFTPDASYTQPWVYRSKNAYIGKELTVDMFGLVQAVEELTGKTLIHERDLPDDQVKDWYVEQGKTQAQRAADIVEWDASKAKHEADTLAAQAAHDEADGEFQAPGNSGISGERPRPESYTVKDPPDWLKSRLKLAGD